MNNQIKCVVIADHNSEFPNPIKLKKDQIVKTISKQTTYPGWIWCINTENISGWVPEKYLILKDNSATANRDYDATEMTVSSGQKLTLLIKEAEWGWCQNSEGEFGWVPLEKLKLL